MLSKIRQSSRLLSRGATSPLPLFACARRERGMTLIELMWR